MATKKKRRVFDYKEGLEFGRRYPNPSNKVKVDSYNEKFEQGETYLSMTAISDLTGWTVAEINYILRCNKNKELCDCKKIKGVIYKRVEINVF